jgi:uncharacterized protein (TIGR03437 family)
MTNPDGTYRIDGIPPGEYYVYAHPLPPAQQGEATPANIVWPLDAAKVPFAPDTGFSTLFFPGTTDWTQAVPVGVVPGIPVNGVNFSVQPRLGPAVYDMQTYAYLGAGNQVPVAAPPLASGTRTTMVFYANGTVVNNSQPAPGLNVGVIGGAALVEPGSLAYYTQGFLLMTVDANAVSVPTPVALAVTVNGDLYVLPAAFTVVPGAPPSISALIPGADAAGKPLVTVQGSNLSAGTRVVFDGVRTTLRGINPDGSLVVAPPAASSGYSAAVEALNADGQSSSQALGPALPPLFTYAGAAPAVAVVRTPAGAAAGADTMVEIIGVNTNFADGQAVAGFGSSDLTVRRLWVTGPGRLLLNLSVGPQALPGLATTTVISGLEAVPLGPGFQVLAPSPNQASLRSDIVNLTTGQPSVTAGSFILIGAAGLPQNLGGASLTIGGERVLFSVNSPGQIVAQVPQQMAVGPSIVQLILPGAAVSPAVVLQVDPPAILAAVHNSGVAVDSAHPAGPGDLIGLTVSGFADYSAQALLSAVRIEVGGVAHLPVSVTSSPTQAGAALMQFVLSPKVPAGPQTPVTAGFGTRVSAAYPLATRNP